MTETLTAISGALGIIITALFTYRLGLKKAISEAKKDELSNVDEAIRIWRETAEDLAKKVKTYESIYDKCLILIAQNKQLLLTVKRLEAEVHKLTNER